MKISVVVPAYNEEENVIPLSKAITQVLENKLSDYDYELIFIDNNSTDNTRYLLRDICNDNKRYKRNGILWNKYCYLQNGNWKL